MPCQSQRIAEEDKRRLVNAFEDANQDYFQMAQILNIKRTTAWSTVNRYTQNGVV